jgi:hypothetical protein
VSLKNLIFQNGISSLPNANEGWGGARKPGDVGYYNNVK